MNIPLKPRRHFLISDIEGFKHFTPNLTACLFYFPVVIFMKGNESCLCKKLHKLKRRKSGYTSIS